MKTILLVDDDELGRDILSRRLQRRGYTILHAGAGEEAIAVASLSRPDLILMDMTLPGLDGWETTRQLRRTPGIDRIPVIALTANTLPRDRERALAAGCNEYEPKPPELSELIQKIEALLTPTTSTKKVDVRKSKLATTKFRG